jgi:hypothetical protein
MTEEQQLMVSHLADLNRKMRSAQFNMDQLKVGRDAFMNMLKQSLSEETAETEEEAA